MNWRDEAIERLAAKPCCGYGVDDDCATEPTALAALALAGAGRAEAIVAADMLASYQGRDGSLGVRRDLAEPRWPTSLGILAWTTIHRDRFSAPIRRAIRWTLSIEGKALQSSEQVGHDTNLVAWPWVDGTHSWIEPTALHVLALRASGFDRHPRTREAIRLLLDRQLPGGGCNYGNTTVLGRTLRPHVQPTGIAMLALGGIKSAAVERSLSYLRRSLSNETTTTSLCWALLGLAAHGEFDSAASGWLQSAYERTQRGGSVNHRLALLVLASLGKRSPLIDFPRKAPA